MISVHNLLKSFGNQIIFDHVSFSFHPFERIGLVGRNGHGKTTLFRILTGEEQYDEGSILLARQYKIGYMKQNLEFQEETILKEASLGLPDHKKNEEWEAKKILAGLGFKQELFNEPPKILSGGFQVRLNLAKTLLSDANLLLLDEPTNFLDIVSIRWLTDFLNNWPNELILISHDRGFLDHIVTHIMGIHRTKIRKIKGQTSHYYNQISLEDNIHEKQRQNDERMRKQMKEFINKFRAKARHANLVQSRIKALDRKQKKDKLEKITSLSFSFNTCPFNARTMLKASGINFSYSGSTPYLIENFNLELDYREKICVIGKNGKGKTTLLKTLADKLSPQKGRIKYHANTSTAYFEQSHTAFFNPEFSIEEELLASASTGEIKMVRDICGAMMFSGDTALKKIKILSGGEKCRVLLGKLLLSQSNLLLLDEPTHHLDMESTEALAEAIKQFPGSAIVVTHNETLLRKIAHKLIVFQKGQIFTFSGGYDEFLDQIGWEEESHIEEETSLKKLKTSIQKKDKKENKKAKAEFINLRSRTLTPYRKKIEILEKTIHTMENEIKNTHDILIQASLEQNAKNIKESSRKYSEKKEQLDELYHKWEQITLEYENEQKRLHQMEDSL